MILSAGPAMTTSSSEALPTRSPRPLTVTLAASALLRRIQAGVGVVFQGVVLLGGHVLADVADGIGAAASAMRHLWQKLAALQTQARGGHRVRRRQFLKHRAFHRHQRHEDHDIRAEGGNFFGDVLNVVIVHARHSPEYCTPTVISASNRLMGKMFK